MARQVIYLTTAGAGTWNVPADWNNTDNTVECIGGGGAGGYGAGSFYGGGGGAYSLKNNLSLTAGGTADYSVGAGGIGSRANDVNAGGDTWFKSTSDVLAKGGQGGNTNTGYGGDAAAGVGDTKYSGGRGGNRSGYSYGGGGGGAAGKNSNGGAGQNATSACNPPASARAGIGGVGGTGGGGVGGMFDCLTYYADFAGGAGTEWDATHGSGGGGSGSYNGSVTNGSGGKYGGGSGQVQNDSQGHRGGYQGVIRISYEPAALLKSLATLGVGK